MDKDKKANCYKCEHSRTIPGDCHLSCTEVTAEVRGSLHGRKSGWFYWPHNFDPVWLLTCDSFKPIKEK